MKITNNSKAEPTLPFDQTERSKVYRTPEAFGFFLKTDEMTMVNLSNGVVLTERAFVSSARFAEVDAEVVIK